VQAAKRKGPDAASRHTGRRLVDTGSHSTWQRGIRCELGRARNVVPGAMPGVLILQIGCEGLHDLRMAALLPLETDVDCFRELDIC